MSLSVEEIKERIKDLKEFQIKANETQYKNLQQTIDYYQKLLNQKEPKPHSPSLAQLRSQAQEKYLQNHQIKVPPPVPIEIQNQILKTSFNQRESSFSKRPPSLSSSFKDIVYTDSDEEEEKLTKLPEKSPNFLLFTPTNNYEFLKPEKWGPAYNLLADITSTIGKKIFGKEDNHEKQKFMDLTPKSKQVEEEKEEEKIIKKLNQEVQQEIKLEEKQKEILQEIDQKLKNPKIEQVERVFEEEKLDKEAEKLLTELHSSTNEEESVSQDTERELEELERNGIEEKTAEEELEDLEQQTLREKIDCKMFDLGVFEIETSFNEEFQLLRKSFIEAVSNVKKWKNESLVDDNDKVVSQEKNSSGVVIQLESGKKVIYSPLTGASKITFPNGKIIQKNSNGDYKLILPKDKIINYTQKSGLYHVTNASKEKNYSYAFYYIRSGACVKMYKNGNKIQTLPSGDKILYKDGKKEIVFESGLKQRIHSNRVKEVFLNSGKKYLTI